jgi:hypothetical protein
MRRLLHLLLFIPFGLLGQDTLQSEVVAQNPVSNNPARIPRAAPSETIPQGVIKVRKPQIRPYFKCEYYLQLANARMVQVEVPSRLMPGTVELDNRAYFDSVSTARFEPIYPRKSFLFSKFLSENVDFSYSYEDSASIDTMYVEMWISHSGKIRWKDPDTTYYGGMPRELALRIYLAMMGTEEWGTGGGYLTPKKFMRKQKRMAGDYYCLLYVIASAKPLTIEQKSTDSHYAPFDIPLNTPPENEQQRDFLKGNNIQYYDNETMHRK